MAPIPPYGVAIHEAIKSGDTNAMKKAKADAEAYLKDHDDIEPALDQLKAAIGRLTGKSGIVPLYGVVIHEAIACGDLARMKAVMAQGQAQLAEAADVRTALAALRAKIGE